jgi:predicted transcriptional regulator of viral defense system
LHKHQIGLYVREVPLRAASGRTPSWDRLYETAASQAGYVTQKQAAEAGYSPQLVQHYVRERRLERAERGVLRIVHFPPSDHEDLAVLWLWSERLGVFSHETALMLHELSDALPAKRHMTVPASWANRRLRLPRGLVLHFSDMPKRAVTWVGPIPVTTPVRTIADCAESNVSEDFVRQAIEQGTRRGLFDRVEVNAAIRRARKQRNGAPSNLREP